MSRYREIASNSSTILLQKSTPLFGFKSSTYLNRFRNETFTDEDIKILEGRVSSDKFEISEAEHVAYQNEEVTIHNRKMMSKLTTKEYMMKAKKPPLKGYTPYINPKTGNVAKTSFKDELVLKVGARVILVHNINTIDEFR